MEKFIRRYALTGIGLLLLFLGGNYMYENIVLVCLGIGLMLFGYYINRKDDKEAEKIRTKKRLKERKKWMETPDMLGLTMYDKHPDLRPKPKKKVSKKKL